MEFKCQIDSPGSPGMVFAVKLEFKRSCPRIPRAPGNFGHLNSTPGHWGLFVQAVTGGHISMTCTDVLTQTCDSGTECPLFSPGPSTAFYLIFLE